MMTSRRLALILALGTLSATFGASFGRPAWAADAPAQTYPGNPQVRITTSMGEFVVELYPDRAPITVAEFLRYVKEGQYTQTLFHRVIPGFLAQGGGFGAADETVKPTHGVVFNESGNGLQNKRGWVGLARTEAAHSGNCQFYINLADNPELDPLPVRWGYAVFGRVIDGMDVLDKIGAVPTGAEGKFKSDAPLTKLVIEKIEQVSPDGVKVQQKQLAPAPTGNEVLSPN
jgi:peptidyl-prolyl cis-trans isomerase A (cyclophilin A)/peptidyl-prolyl cis-trans isomerase B (cyclophilin B)